MPEDMFYLTGEDVATLRKMISQFKGTIRRERLSPEYDEDTSHQAPEVYIAKVPAEGIPAVSKLSVGTAAVGESPEEGDLPGYATCDIFQIVEDRLTATGRSVLVYNLSKSVIEESWACVERDKFGKWVVLPSASSSSGSSSGGGGGCCCDPTVCEPNKSVTGDLLGPPDAYYFSLASKSAGGFNCQCSAGDESQDGEVILEIISAGSNTYRSPTFTCPYNSPTTEPCTITSTWKWVLDTCTGGCTYVWLNRQSPGSGCVFGKCAWGAYEYDGASGCPPSCYYTTCNGYPVVGTIIETPCSSDCGEGCHCDDAAYAALSPGTTEGQTVTIPCIKSGVNGHWELVSTDVPTGCTCSSMPVEPDYTPDWDGTGDNPTAETECSGTRSVGSEVVQAESYWELKRGLTDYYGNSYCTLQLKVGSTIKLSYISTDPGGCCTYCQNTFKLNSCGPYDCSSVKGTICLSAGYPKLTGKSSAPCFGVVYPLPDTLNYSITFSGSCTGDCWNPFTLPCPLVQIYPSAYGQTSIWRSNWYRTTHNYTGGRRTRCWNLSDDVIPGGPGGTEAYPNSVLYFWYRAVIVMESIDPAIHDGNCNFIGAYLEWGGQGYVGAPFGDYTSGAGAHYAAPPTINTPGSTLFTDCMSDKCLGPSAIFPCPSICGKDSDPGSTCFTQTVSVPT